jgi:hypothetical protein
LIPSGNFIGWPHHSTTCSGEVSASQTTERGAAIRVLRVIVPASKSASAGAPGASGVWVMAASWCN